MDNGNLSFAKRKKKDEFLTQYSVIEKEVSAYLDYDLDVFRGKTNFLPCDDPEWSNFTKYFAQNFARFGLKELISINYAVENKTYENEISSNLAEKAKANSFSNQPLSGVGHGANKVRVWKLSEMDTGHVTAWSKGGATSLDNCQMLCKIHNLAK